jgi:hypothetical protein
VGQQLKVIIGLLHRHVWVCWPHDRWVGGVWCGGLPNCGCLFPSSNGTVVEILGIGATISRGPHRLGLSQDNGEVGDTNSSGVVCLNESAWLRPTHLDESLTEGDHFLGCGVESA